MNPCLHIHVPSEHVELASQISGQKSMLLHIIHHRHHRHHIRIDNIKCHAWPFTSQHQELILYLRCDIHHYTSRTRNISMATENRGYDNDANPATRGTALSVMSI